jgi:hypothetical protein
VLITTSPIHPQIFHPVAELLIAELVAEAHAANYRPAFQTAIASRHGTKVLKVVCQPLHQSLPCPSKHNRIILGFKQEFFRLET